MPSERLQKLIAHSGIASRRQAEELIVQGKVKVNGQVVRELGSTANVEEGDIVLVSNKPLPRPQTVVYAVNKPKGVVCSRQRQGNEQLITELVPSYPPVYPVGRLDKESEGLILLTNDGALTQKVTHPSFRHEKEYRISARFEKDWELPDEKLITRLEKGVKLGDGMAKAEKVTIKHLTDGTLDLSITVQEGRHHLIRRMCASVGLEVRRLTRVRIAGLTLTHIKSGTYRALTPKDLALLG